MPSLCLLTLTLCAALHDRPVVALSSAHVGALLVDGVTTSRFVARGDREGDPLARVFVGSRPSWSRMLPAGAAVVIAQTYLAERMRRSHNSILRKIWWLPQSVSIQVSLALASTN